MVSVNVTWLQQAAYEDEDLDSQYVQSREIVSTYRDYQAISGGPMLILECLLNLQ